MAKSTLTSKGQITIPKELRERFGLETGDVLDFVEDEQGRLLLRPRRPRGALGVLGAYAPDRPVSVDEMRQAVSRRAAAKAGKDE
jgi:antitoxin PrlF